MENTPSDGPSNFLIDLFQDHLLQNRRLSQYTSNSYAVDLRQLAAFLLGDSLNTLPECEKADAALIKAGPTDIFNFVERIKSQGYKATSVARKIAAVHTFYKWLLSTARVSENPTKDMKSPKIPPSEVVVLSQEQMKTLINSASGDDLLSLRDKAIIMVFCNTGMRASEVRLLTDDHVNFELATIKVPSKIPGSRPVFISTATCNAIRKYLDAKVAAQFGHVALFVNKNGEPLSERSMRRKLEKYLALSGISVRVSPSTLRRSFLKKQVESGVELADVSSMLGHRNKSTVANIVRAAKIKKTVLA